MLEINELTKQYKPGKPIFNGISKQFEAGSRIGFIGPNGSGKTTFLRILSVNSFPTSGEVLFEGLNIHQSPHQYLKNVGLVHDEESLPQHLSASELLQWILRSRSLWNDDSHNQINNILDALSLVERDEPIGTYSTGMRKKTQIAAAFIIKPKVLILDEPLRGLDASTREVVFGLLDNAKTQNTLILMASHSMGTAPDFFDEIVEFPL
ncbi:ATP-binding cassette domain-containing protein [Rhodohalobacter sp. 614A]|uniref:ATP-binding cassette domain-containing protein n=1 Tax=Rhodohalobacter sp. 614A TaxID=2908649 RepID=UPI001F2782EF|nr:ABC transporter ATP-binding protein [Rhodohalobacter sp. 614A]